MHIVRDRNTKKILHVDYSASTEPLPSHEVYAAFDDKAMELGWTDKSYIPGYFTINDEGEIIENSIENAIKKEQYLLDMEQKFENGKIIKKNNKELVSENILSLDELKSKCIEEYSNLAFMERRKIIPDYKLENAALGVYDTQRISEYKSIVKAFRNEFHRLEKLVNKATTESELDAISPNYSKINISDEN